MLQLVLSLFGHNLKYFLFAFMYILTTDQRPTDPLISHFENFNDHYLRNGSADSFHVWLYCAIFGDVQLKDDRQRFCTF